MTAARLKKAKAELKQLKKFTFYKIEAVKFIKKYKPANLKEFKDIGFRFNRLGNGVFRVCYKFKDLDIVIKVPNVSHSYGESSGNEHSKAEVEAVKVLAKEKPLARYLPKIHYSTKDGEVIVMPLYEFQFTGHDIVADMLGHLMNDLGHNGSDIHHRNVARDDYGNYYMADLGYWSYESW